MRLHVSSCAAVFIICLSFPSAAAVRYVNASNTAPAYPYATWSDAALTIQDAVNAADPGDEVLVTNGLYQTGGQIVYGSMNNRVAVTKPIMVRSVNGPSVTTITGYQVPGTTNGDGAIRCVYLTNGASPAQLYSLLQHQPAWH